MLKKLYQPLLGVLVVVMASSAIAEVTNAEVVFNDMHDLDGDGVKEKIILSSIIVNDRKSKYELKIADQVVHGEYETGEDDRPKIEIIDIDKNDNMHELLLTTLDGMYTCHYNYYNYRNNKIHKLLYLSSGHCDGKPMLQGNGILIHSIWNIFYVDKDKYRFDSDKNKIRSFYSSYGAVNVQVTVKKKINLYSVYDLEEIISNALPGDKLNAILYDPRTSMLLVSDEDSFYYWVNYDSISSLEGMPYAS